jgi:drug/metabolite transporter (DMT)-like permease
MVLIKTHYTITSGLYITAQTASPLASLELVWGIIFAILLLGAIPSPRTILGGAIIITAALLPGILRLLRLGVILSAVCGVPSS